MFNPEESGVGSESVMSELRAFWFQLLFSTTTETPSQRLLLSLSNCILLQGKKFYSLSFKFNNDYHTDIEDNLTLSLDIKKALYILHPQHTR